ncbi:MAG: hypothetical protein ABEJ36_02225 [Candidatus Nanosalina sp.]
MTSFRTKRGRCILDSENLYLSSSWTGQLKRYWEGGGFGKFMLVSLAMLPVIILSNFLMVDEYSVLSGLGIGLGLGLGIMAFAYIVNYFRGFSTDRVIHRDGIEEFKAVEGSKGVTRPRFIVKFEKGGETRNRYIMMPSKILSYGEEEFGEAKEKLRDEGFKVVEED